MLNLAGSSTWPTPPCVTGSSPNWGFSLHADVKVTEGAQHPDRHAQFEYLGANRSDEFAFNLTAGEGTGMLA